MDEARHVWCMAGAVCGVALWVAFREPNVGIVVSNAVICVGAIPTFRSVWRDPSAEDRTAWLTFWVSCVLAAFAIPRWSIADVALPLVAVTIQSVMMYLLFVRPQLRALA